MRGTPLNPLTFGNDLEYCVIFDLDGTLACIGDRSPYNPKECLGDKPNHSILAINQFIPNNVHIFVFSGRSEDSRKETLEWMDRYGVRFNDLCMRRAGDFRKDAIIKEELFNAYIRGKFNVLFAIDDRNQVVELWRKLGITTLQVNAGEF